MTASPFARLERLPQAASTNTVLRDAAAAEPDRWPHLSAVLAEHQTAGRGRAGRGWVTPPGAALTASLLLRPHVPPERAAWLTLLSGLAVVRAVRALAPASTSAVGLKWPNDVLVPDAGPELAGWGTARKLGGILTELLPTTTGRPAAVVGIGLNLSQDHSELPVASATSLALAGLPVPPAEELLVAVGRELGDLVTRWEASGGDPRAAGLLDEVSEVCLSIGRAVRVERPAAAPLLGTAEEIDDGGGLVVRDPGGERHRVLAGDVLHVRRQA
ncbi:biotin--[acetyl-CoA-carboxylase] ligase [Georgenia sp. H159]|uniref:biotin--[acetyl-CoA-carboxylase] ligase n=1 Tax=Georgenia sp. H159 TaxID=3076115 RepID=UPI002D77410A|nr:biotin--[acetyl-CoA-carboxylase] ligase [Georgenia sp. H159]